MAMQEAWQMERRSDIATAFGAGIGRQGSVCGAVTGGIIAINLKYGRTKAEDVISQLPRDKKRLKRRIYLRTNASGASKGRLKF